MSLTEEFARWRKQVLDPSIKRFAERKGHFETSSGIEIPALSLPNVANFSLWRSVTSCCR